MQKRVWFCTLVTLVATACGAIGGGQFHWQSQIYRCQSGLGDWAAPLCQAWSVPGTLRSGVITGAWCGMVLGAFFAGLASHKWCD